MNQIQIVGQIDKTKQKILLGKSQYAELLIHPSSEEMNDIDDGQYVQITGDIWSHPVRSSACIIRVAMINNFPADKEFWSTGSLRLHSPAWEHCDTFSSRSLVTGVTEGRDSVSVLMSLSESKWAKKVGSRVRPNGYIDIEVKVSSSSKLMCVSILADQTTKSAKKQGNLPSWDVLDAYDKKCQEKGRSPKKRRNISPKVRREIFIRDGFKCQECGAYPGKDKSVCLHVDHIVPVAKGGSNESSNLRTLCDTCNFGKGVEDAVIH